MEQYNIHPNTYQAYRLFHEGILALSRAEQQGIRVDMKYAENKKKELTQKIESIEQEIKKTSFYRHWDHSMNGTPNLYSNQQLSNFLYKVKKVEVSKTTTSGQGATDEEALLDLQIPELKQLLEVRKLKKIRDTYLEAFIREQVDGYIHPFFNLHIVKTFRSSSDSPNFQNIPKRDEEAMQIVRKALYPRPGHQLLEIDYSGIEVRIAAAYHKDPVMLKYLHDPSSDMHGDMSKVIYKMPNFDKSIPSHSVLRAATKNGFVFPEFYGDYYKNCAEYLSGRWLGLPQSGQWKSGQGLALPKGTISDHLIANGIKNLSSFTEHMKGVENLFWKRFKVYAKWKESWWNDYQRKGYADTLTGFRFSGVMGKNDVINYPVQGAAFHCLLWSFKEIDKLMIQEKWDSKLIGQIHDSIILDVAPKELKYIGKVVHRITCEDMPKHFNWINTPMDVEAEICPVDGSWAEKGKYKLL